MCMPLLLFYAGVTTPLGGTLSRDEKSKVLRAKQRFFRGINMRSAFDEQEYQEDPKVKLPR